MLTLHAHPQEDDDAPNADTFIKKAGFLLSDNQDEALELQYNTCYARILDAKVRAVPAASGCVPADAAARAAAFHRGGAALLPPQPASEARDWCVHAPVRA
jgi:hypothetical protein